MADQQDKTDAEGSFPIGGGGIKDVRKLNIKMGFRTLSSPRKVDKGRTEHNSMTQGWPPPVISTPVLDFLLPLYQLLQSLTDSLSHTRDWLPQSCEDDVGAS